MARSIPTWPRSRLSGLYGALRRLFKDEVGSDRPFASADRVRRYGQRGDDGCEVRV